MATFSAILRRLPEPSYPEGQQQWGIIYRGTSSLEAVNNASPKADVHRRSIGGLYMLLFVSPWPYSSIEEYAQRMLPHDLNRANFKCADVDAQQIWQIRSGTDWKARVFC